MKLTTDFWGKEKFDFSELFYINGVSKEIIYKANLNDKWDTYRFFRNIAIHAQKEKNLVTYDRNGHCRAYFQFAVMNEEKITPIVWFTLVINDKLSISRDKAFDTELIKRNDIRIPFGKFPMCYKRLLPLYRQYNIKSRAMKFISNQVLK